MNKLRVVLCILSLALVFSCKKKDDNSVLGLDVQPENDLLGVTMTDSVSVYMHTQNVLQVRSYNDQYKFLGSIQDPVFGVTHSGIYTNFSIANSLTNLSFGSDAVLDHAELVIRDYGNSIGNVLQALTYDVYLLNNQLSSDSSYRTNSTISRGPKINSGSAKYEIRNSLQYLVIPLDFNLAQAILSTDANLVNNTAFQAAYKGLYITTENTPLGAPGSGFIKSFDLDDALSGVNLYYKNVNSTDSKIKSFLFTFKGTDALRFNHIDHNYSSGATTNLFQQLSGDSAKGNDHVYLNVFGGTRVRVYLPYLKNFSDSQNVSISRAELIIKIDDSMFPVDTVKYPYPENLALIGCTSTGTEELVYDMLDGSDLTKYNAKLQRANKQYVFNIGRQMQKILNGSVQNYGFYLVNAEPITTTVARRDNRFSRVYFGGKTNAAFKPYFKVTYIKFPYDK